MARIKPKKREMTRADSLMSIQRYGRIVPLDEQVKLGKKRKPGFINRLKAALGGK